MGIPTIIGMIGLERIRAAADRARPYVYRTPMVPVDGAMLKLECLQPTGSFKVRGFFAAALALPEESRSRGLITVSAGNAAQACAYAAKMLGVPCRVVMYDTAPATKIEGVKRWGGVPMLLPRPKLLDWLANEGWKSEPETFIHPFADTEVMAGHGGLVLELVEDVTDLARRERAAAGGNEDRGRGQWRQHRSEAAGDPTQLRGAGEALPGDSIRLVIAHGPWRITATSIQMNRAVLGIPSATESHVTQTGRLYGLRGVDPATAPTMLKGRLMAPRPRSTSTT